VAEDGDVEEGGVGRAKVVKTSGSTAGVGTGQIRGVGVYTEEHVGRVVDERVGGVVLGVS